MKRIYVIAVTLTVFSVMLWSAETFSPLQVKRGKPVTFSTKERDPKPWIAKTTKEKAPIWFRYIDTQKSHWYIDWDAERRPFTKIVIHHSETAPTATADEIERIHITRLYQKRYALSDPDPYVIGLPIHSNHVINGKETLIGYHHLVYPSGKITTELQPLVKVKNNWLVDMVGWHAGRWTINCESIAICLVGSYTNSEPSKKAIAATKKLVAYYRSFNPNLTVHPHKEFSATQCPGGQWESWKNKIQ